MFSKGFYDFKTRSHEGKDNVTLTTMRQKIKDMLNSFPNNKISDRSKLKAFADDKIDVTENLKFILGRVENIAGKGENAGYQHFLLFPQCF